MTRVHVGANSEAYGAARQLADSLSAAGHDVQWHGAPEHDLGDDYPAIVVRTVQAVVEDEDAGRESRAVILGGAGAGEVIAANKVAGGRVVSATDPAYVVTAREHADVNGLVVPVALVGADAVAGLVRALLDTPFSGDLDDARRLVNIAEFETAGTIEGWTVQP